MLEVVTTTLVAVEYLLKVVAVGTVPENRRPSSGQAWLLLILFLPVVGLPLFLLIGSPYVHGRRHRLQAEANRAIEAYTAQQSELPVTADVTAGVATLVTLNRRLTAMPCVQGVSRALHPDSDDTVATMAEAIAGARSFVHLEVYVLALDAHTAPVFDALAAAVRRGVAVRVLYDHLGSRKYSGHPAMNRRLTADGVQWHRMMPIDPLRRRWRRPDLRNHRKLLLVDGQRAFMGSQNLIDPSYHSRRNERLGRRWVDLNVELSGEVVHSLDVVFATDWYAETGEQLQTALVPPHPDPPTLDPVDLNPVALVPTARDRPGLEMACQLVPSGPGFPTEPNLRLFTSVMHQAQRRVSIVSPYFVPDESLLAAITTAAYRGVAVELFVSEKADQFMVHHAQRSYYRGLLEAGVRIHRYPAPAVLHTKLVVVDEEVALIGSSNMDMRSFALDYEIMLMMIGSDVVAGLDQVVDGYRDRSGELDLDSWRRRPWPQRYLDNALRLTAALQ